MRNPVITIVAALFIFVSLLQPSFAKCAYPLRARLEGAQGKTTVTFRIMTNGTVKDVVVVHSSGNAALDQATIDCVSKWHYTPTIKGSKPPETTRSAWIRWRLE